MKVERIWEAPRVTKPYTEEQWAEIEKLGHADRRAAAGRRRAPHHGRRAHVRVGRRSGRRRVEHHRDGPRQAPARHRGLQPAQGEVRAAGPVALRPGQVVSGRAAAALVAQLLLAPRRRADLAEPGAARRRDAGSRRHAEHRRRVPRRRRRATGLWRPNTCSPPSKTRSITCGASASCRRTSIRSSRSSRIRMERARLAKVFEQGLDAVVGHVLPVARDARMADAGAPGPWFLRRERCYLIPGDSPMGYRLPLDSQPWVNESDYPYMSEPDPMAPPRRCRASPRSAASSSATRDGDPATAPSTERRRRAARARRRGRAMASSRPHRAGIPAVCRRHHAHRACAPSRATALSIYSCRRPSELEDYLELVAAIEATAEDLDTPVVLEGYEPPKDPRLNSFPRDARSGRHRGEHPSVRQLGRAGRPHHAPLRRRAPVAG